MVTGNSTTFNESRGFSRVTFTFHMRRKPLYYIANLVIPCCLLSCIAVVTFILPPNCFMRLTLSTYNHIDTLDSTRRVKHYATNRVANWRIQRKTSYNNFSIRQCTGVHLLYVTMQ